VFALRFAGAHVASPAPRRRGCLLVVATSYAGMLTQPSSSSLGIRTVEWLRDNGARGLVNRVENLYYTLRAPATGGPALRSLPTRREQSESEGRALGRLVRGFLQRSGRSG